MLEEYDPESPTASLQKHGLASQAAASPPTYGAMAARASRNAAPHPSRAQPDRIQLLKDKCIVDQAKGSAQLAALSGGRRVKKVIARLEEEASARTQDSIDIVEYLSESRARQVKILKSTWKEAKELVNMSGFGWDDDMQKVTADEDVWDDLVKRRPEFKKWRTKSFPSFNRMDALNSKSTATGAFARDGGAAGEDGEEEGDDEDEDGDGDGDDDENDTTPAARKRSRPSAVTAMADIASALRAMGSQDEGLGEALAELLERDSEHFEEDELASLGLALADKPRLASVYHSFAEKPELRHSFLRKVLASER
ncbi:hypothetical protein CF335_g5849 [Tilletia laevis]|nr:hypothetical protein CF335_g5849 [Tilletia laevis]